MTEPPLIQLEKIGKVFCTDEVETHALVDIDLEIHEGEFLSIAGPSGCGKSTLLSVLGFLEPPTSGTYLFQGQNTTELSLRDRTRLRNCQIGFVFQSFNLIGDLTVRENVELPLTYRPINRRARQQCVAGALERVGMTHRSNHYPAQLSGGQQQRVAVARAIAGNPATLLADEPTGNLDSASGEAVMDLLKELHSTGATICMVTHDPRYVRHATRTVNLYDGHIVESALSGRLE